MAASVTAGRGARSTFSQSRSRTVHSYEFSLKTPILLIHKAIPYGGWYGYGIGLFITIEPKFPLVARCRGAWCQIYVFSEQVPRPLSSKLVTVLYVPRLSNLMTHPSVRCRATMAHIRQPRPDFGLGFQAKVVELFEAVSSSIGRGILAEWLPLVPRGVERVYEVVLQKSIPAQIRQLIL